MLAHLVLAAAAAAAILATAAVAQPQEACETLTCSGRGRCEAGACVCWRGYEGTNCERESADPLAAPMVGPGAVVSAAGSIITQPQPVHMVGGPLPREIAYANCVANLKPGTMCDPATGASYTILAPDYMKPKPPSRGSNLPGDIKTKPYYFPVDGIKTKPYYFPVDDIQRYPKPSPSSQPSYYPSNDYVRYPDNSRLYYDSFYDSYYYNNYNPNSAYGNQGMGNAAYPGSSYYNNNHNYYNPNSAYGNPNSAYGNQGMGNTGAFYDWYPTWNYPSNTNNYFAGGSTGGSTGGGSTHVVHRCFTDANGMKICT